MSLSIVSNGVYQTGGRVVSGTLTNRIAVTKPVTVQSVNGPAVTLIQGHQVPGTTNGNSAVRCVYLTDGATLIGFTLTNGATQTAGVTSGGGVWCSSTNSVVSNCVLVGNSAYSAGGGACSGTLNFCSVIGNSVLAPGRYPGASPGGPSGGGAYASRLNNCTLVGNFGFLGAGVYNGTLNNCTIVSNSAARGGGTYSSRLNNCTISSNSATNSGGGAYSGTLNNCIVYFNTSTNGANYYQNQFDGVLILNYCCTVPMPTNGIGNITNDPLYLTPIASDLHLQSNSPCINAGLNAYAPAGPDLDGNSRIVGGTVDIGACEFQSPVSMISYAWLQQYGLPIATNTDSSDPDGDGMNNWQEWCCLTDPTNAASVLKLQSPVLTPPGVLVRWGSDSNHAYGVERATSLTPPVAFSLLQSNIPGLSPTTAFTDTSAPLQGAAFYRVRADSTNPSLPLVLQAPVFVPASLTLCWSSVTNRTYFLERSTNLAQPATFSVLQSNVTGQVGTTSYTDTNAVGDGPFFYRVGVSQ